MIDNTEEKKVPASVLAEEQKPVEETFAYNDKETLYLKNLQKRLEYAREQREQPREEFDGMTYSQRYNVNEELANIRLKPKKDKNDIQYQSETLRTKLFSFLSSLIGLNLEPDITAFDENNIVILNLGNAVESIILKCNELDQDEEKQILRFYELLKQGTVFVEDVWDDRQTVEKADIKDYKGQFRGVNIKSKLKKTSGRPVRNIISGLSVYLGDLTKYLIEDQPYIFTVTNIRWDEGEKMYGKFDMFKYVKKTYTPIVGFSDEAMIKNEWRLNIPIPEGKIQVIRYQDKPNKEYQIILNGVPMLPIGFSFPWGYDEYNIAQQNLKPIRADFAYGGSFVFENKNSIQLLDEMKKLALLKTYQSFLPPYLNISGRVISSKVFMPGEITMGLTPGSLHPLLDKGAQGVTNSEFAMMQEIAREIDANTATQAGSNVEQRGKALEVEVIEIQRQARIMLGITIASVCLLEKKLSMLRLLTILKYWFNPIDKKLDEARKLVRNIYRIVSSTKMVSGEGLGIQIVVPTENLPNSESLMQTENQLKTQLGAPVRIIALNPNEITSVKLIWQMNITPREKKSSDLSKMMFDKMVSDARNLGLILNQGYVQEEFAEIWEKDPTKLFSLAQQGMSIQGSPGNIPSSTPVLKTPTVNINQEQPLTQPPLR